MMTDDAWKTFYLDGKGEMFAAYATLKLSQLSELGSELWGIYDDTDELASVIMFSHTETVARSA